MRRLDFEHVERMMELARSGRGEGRVSLPGLELVRSFEWMRLGTPEESTPGYRFDLTPPGQVRVPGGETCVVLEVLQLQTAGSCDPERSGYNTNRGNILDLERVAQPLALRNFEAGDRFWPAGASGPVKVKVLFHHSRIPSWERPGWPVITSGQTIVWVRHFGVANGWVPGAQKGRVLRITEVDRRDAESKSHVDASQAYRS